MKKLTSTEIRNLWMEYFTEKGHNVMESAPLVPYDDDSLLKHHAVNGEIKKDSVRMEYYFAKHNGFKVGDTIKAKMPDNTISEFKIDATIVSPEASIVKADPYSISSSREPRL